MSMFIAYVAVLGGMLSSVTLRVVVYWHGIESHGNACVKTSGVIVDSSYVPSLSQSHSKRIRFPISFPASEWPEQDGLNRS